MATPTTARFGKFRVLLGETGAAQPAVAVVNLMNTNPAAVQVNPTDIDLFESGQIVEIAGATGDLASANGAHRIGTVDTGAASFTIPVDLSGASAPGTTGITAEPPAPITFAAPCGFTSKSFTLSKNLQEIDIPDCDDPDQISWIGRDAQNLSATIAGDGIAAAESVRDWNAAYQNLESVDARIEIEFSTGTLAYTGLFQVDNLAFGAEQAGRVTLGINMQSDGPIVDEWITA